MSREDHAPFWGITPKQEPSEPQPPWAVRAVPQAQVKTEPSGAVRVKPEPAVKKEEDERRIRIVPVRRLDQPPWVGPKPRDEASAYQRVDLTPPEQEKEAEQTTTVKKQRAPKKTETTGARLASARNYAAIEAEHGDYGLIDMGQAGGGQSLLIHVARKNHPTPWTVLGGIRPGSTLKAISVHGGSPVTLRVRYTTPARYYSPGARVTTLAVAVDSADWRSLRADAPRI